MLFFLLVLMDGCFILDFLFKHKLLINDVLLMLNISYFMLVMCLMSRLFIDKNIQIIHLCFMHHVHMGMLILVVILNFYSLFLYMLELDIASEIFFYFYYLVHC